MKILVTGGAGFVGASLCLTLRQKYPAYSIVAFDNLRRRGSELNLPLLKEAGVAFIHGDIRDLDDLDQLHDFDIMVEASAEPSVLAGLGSSPNYVINNNFNGSINCFNKCLKQNARIIFLSTSRVYPFDRIDKCIHIEGESRFDFSGEQDEPGISERGIKESFLLEGTRSFYGATKLASELFLKEYGTFCDLRSVIVRFGVIAGPRQMGKTDQGVVGLWMARHYWGRELNYIGYGGTGKQVRDILHIDDAVDLIDILIHRFDEFNSRTFNAGGGLSNSASLREMTSICQRITGNKIPIEAIKEARPADLRCFVCDNGLVTKETGWSPTRNLEMLFQDVYDWIRKNEQLLKTILL